jgi:phosphohistidine swiveling domain-containing protein
MSEPRARLLPLSAALAEEEPGCGGKARGLARLIEHGLRVPPGFVILAGHASHAGHLGVDSSALAAAYMELGAGKVAVRSSALAEDGDASSYAGQYETSLEIEGVAALEQAVARCLASAARDRVRAYEAAHAGGTSEEPAMAVVIQRMVEARCAGVLFTLDPVSGDESRWLIEAVAGLGEGLVSGHARPDRYLLDPEAFSRVSQPAPRAAVWETGAGARDLADAAPLLDDDTLAELLAAARLARERFDHHLDLEWAIDASGEIHWLQARPITSAGALALDELDTTLAHPSPGFTRYNVGEILPGPVTPLSASTVIEMIDLGFRGLYRRLGVFGGPGSADAPDTCVALFHGHLFMNMRAPYLFAAKVGGASKPDADRSLAGRPLDELDGLERRGPLRRAWLGARLIPVLRRAPHEVAGVARGLETFLRLPIPAASEALLARIDELCEFGRNLAEAHMVASTWSGMLTGILEGILGKGQPLTAEQRRALTRLLRVGQVESADIGAATRVLVVAIRDDPEAHARVLEGELDSLLAWLRGEDSGRVGRLFAELIDRHGHRCVRELELRERDWADDPTPLLLTLRASLAAPPAPETEPAAAGPDTSEFSPGAQRALRWLLPKLHDAIRLRERCKSLFVRLVRHLQRHCVALARGLVEGGRLPELDLIFFVTRAELSSLARAGDDERRALVRQAGLRRRALARQAALRFPMVSRELPQPLPPSTPPVGAARLRGTPVSPGVVEGPARVVRNLREAAQLVPGEILIVPFTDAGWTPLFTIAAGLATEIGGTLSHGAVVARELGLPAIVDLPEATRTFTTGQRVRLDADTGVIEALSPRPAQVHGPGG